MSTGSSGAPQFTQKLKSQVTSEGESVRFEVAVSGEPPPTVTWSHNGDVLENSVDIQIKQEGDKHTLFIPEVFDDDAGKYQVKAESPKGMATCEATLVVNRECSISFIFVVFSSQWYLYNFVVKNYQCNSFGCTTIELHTLQVTCISRVCLAFENLNPLTLPAL